MSLTPGLYQIYSGTSPVNRFYIEDRSLNPKRILALPDDAPIVKPVSIF
jgi:hypothetical protein